MTPDPSDLLNLPEDPTDLPSAASGAADPWQVMVVDDDHEVHLLSRLALERFQFEGRGVKVLHAHSAAEARELLARSPEVALILLDVIMETDTAGLDFAEYVRKEAGNTLVRIVLRTGQPGQVPPRDVVTRYEIDDYRTKTELTYDRLLTVVTTALRNYRQLLASERQQQELRRAYAELHEAERRARLIFEGASDGMYLTDEQLVILDANPAAAELLGCGLRELIGTSVLSHVPTEEAPRLAPLLRPEGGRPQVDAEFPFLRRDGSQRLGRVSGSRVRPGLFVNIIRDVTQQRADEALIRRLAYQDRLTGLANRNAFLAQLEQGLAGDAAPALAVLLLSLTNFREVNDTLGHVGGDELLSQVARRLREAMPASATLARTGPAQFGLLLPGLGRDQAEVAAQALLRALQRQFQVGRVPIALQACAGLAEFPQDARHPGELLRQAHVALHAARQQQRPLMHYSDEIDRFSVQRLALVSRLKEAMATDQLQLWFQTRLNLKTDRVRGVEALLRWQHPERGLISEEEFLPVARATGLSEPLQRWLLQAALRQARDWAARGLRLNIAVACPLRHLTNADFVRALIEQVRSSGLPPQTLTLQFRREGDVETGAAILPALQQLAQEGLRLSLDDFSIGRDALAHVRRLPLQEVRLARDAVQALSEDSGLLAARSAVRLAHELRLEVTAEGVDTEASLRQLRLLGCDHAQGFLIGRAMPARELESWLSSARDESVRSGSTRNPLRST